MVWAVLALTGCASRLPPLMSRLPLAVALLAATTVFPVVVHAHARAGRDSHEERGATQLTAAHLPEMCTQSSRLISSPLGATPLLATQAIARGAQVAAPLAVADDEDVPWCVTPDDPRCSPIDHGSLPTQVSAQPKLSSVAPLCIPWPRARLLQAEPAFEQPGQVRAGEHCRLERPPRLGR
jgi:hypothetical protein